MPDLGFGGSGGGEPDFDSSATSIPSLFEEGIRQAALSFPANTGSGGENIAPRAVARLSQPAILVLIAPFMAFEKLGVWCHVVNLVLIVLLPKPDRGRRPIEFLFHLD